MGLPSQGSLERTGPDPEPLNNFQQLPEPTDGMQQDHLPPEPDLPDFPYLPDHGPAIYGPQTDSDNLFTFDVANLPYVPNPVQPVFDSTMYANYPSAELEALIGSASPQSFGNVNEMMQSTPMHGYQGTMAMSQGFEAAISSANIPHQSQVQDCSTWRPGICTPGSTTMDPNGMASLTDRNPQREVLVATVGWLNQIVSLMQ